MRLFYLSTNPSNLLSSSALSSKCSNEARSAVLSYFNASSDYTVVFTANASAALKLVAEAYPFTGGSSLVIGADSHNSVNILIISLQLYFLMPAPGPWHPRICYLPRGPNLLCAVNPPWRV